MWVNWKPNWSRQIYATLRGYSKDYDPTWRIRDDVWDGWKFKEELKSIFKCEDIFFKQVSYTESSQASKDYDEYYHQNIFYDLDLYYTDLDYKSLENIGGQRNLAEPYLQFMGNFTQQLDENFDWQTVKAYTAIGDVGFILIYKKNYKTWKFKTSNAGLEIRIEYNNATDNITINIGDPTTYVERISSLSSLDNKYNDDEYIGFSFRSSSGRFKFTGEYGLESYNEPYTWTTETGESWTPNQLKFPSIIKYSNILNENNSDSGDAVLLPETSSADDASNYEQDENGYCYIKDNEENIVYNKFLNQLARKTKINNGYRINGDQSLELLSFNNNIKDYDKQSGQYLFSKNKTQTYGSKENKNQTDTKQNVPYFGGAPAVYPVLVYSDMHKPMIEVNKYDFNLNKDGSQLIWDGQTYTLNPQTDEVCIYIRTPKTLTPTTSITEHMISFKNIESVSYQAELKKEWTWSGTFECNFNKYIIPNNTSFTFDANKTLDTNIFSNTSQTIYDSIVETINCTIAPSMNLDINYTTSDTYYTKSIKWDKPITLNLTGNIKQVCIRTSQIYPSLYKTINTTHIADAIVYNYYVKPALSLGGIQRGCLPSSFDLLPEKSIQGSNQYDRVVKTNSLQDLTINTSASGGGNNLTYKYNYMETNFLGYEHRFYLNTLMTTNIPTQSIAIVIWKNGKLLLKNS